MPTEGKRERPERGQGPPPPYEDARPNPEPSGNLPGDGLTYTRLGQPTMRSIREECFKQCPQPSVNSSYTAAIRKLAEPERSQISHFFQVKFFSQQAGHGALATC